MDTLAGAVEEGRSVKRWSNFPDVELSGVGLVGLAVAQHSADRDEIEYAKTLIVYADRFELTYDDSSFR